MKVLMLGWEFPPFISGGLGTACYGLTKAMSELNTDVLFVLPRPVDTRLATHVRLLSPQEVLRGGLAPALDERGRPIDSAQAGRGMPGSQEFRLEEFEHVTFRAVDVMLAPYLDPVVFGGDPQRSRGTRAVGAGGGAVEYEAVEPELIGEAAGTSIEPPPPAPAGGGAGQHYGGDLFTEVGRYARFVRWLARRESFDVIHAHDWMTFPAGIAASAISRKPLVIHVHSTEFDRSGIHVHQRIYDIERHGMHFATKIICVSFLTKNIVTSRYAVPEVKVQVVYNAIDINGPAPKGSPPAIRRDEKIVLFLGRITMQKGPEYFLQAARKVLSVMDNVRFVMAGSGDLIRKSIEMAAEMGIGHKVLFTGFLRGEDVNRVFKMADLYVMPSVSEPFGIAPLEAMSHDVPVIISKQSGVAEVLTHVLKVDFWDVDEMANKIIAVLRHPPLQATLRQHGNIEVRKLTWHDSARHCIDVYQSAIDASRGTARACGGA
ncbi:MAG: glycosyltransferase [Phycisphaerae bacterium]|nr:glycosyltransferase [Phycisphaerae bacterium]